MIITPAVQIWTDASWHPERGGHYAAIIGAGPDPVKIGGVLAEHCLDGHQAEVMAWFMAVVAAAELHPTATAFRVHTDAMNCIGWYKDWIHNGRKQPAENMDWRSRRGTSKKNIHGERVRGEKHIRQTFEAIHEFLGARQMHLVWRSSQDTGDSRLIWCDRVAFQLNCYQIDTDDRLDRYARPRPKKAAPSPPG